LPQLGLPNRCPLYETKKHINAKQFDIAINFKNAHEKTAARANIT